VQTDPLKPTLKPPGTPGTKRLKLEYDEQLSECAFEINLHRYCMAKVYDYNDGVLSLGRVVQVVIFKTRVESACGFSA